MIPETFQVNHKSASGGILRGIMHHSLSFKNALDRSAMPPLKVFNDFMACGCDDVIDLEWIYVDPDDMEGAIMEWKPFSLTSAEYGDLLDYLRELGHQFEIVDYKTSSYKVWFEKCFS